LLCLWLLSTIAAAQQFAIVVEGGRVMDPATCLDAVRNVGIRDGKIARISTEPLAGQRVIQAVGLVVGPGFIDLHQHGQELASQRLKLDRMPVKQRERLKLIHGSLMYRDKRFEGYDAATVVEVIEHLDPPRLAAFERVLFESARPKTVIVTTPNAEYNVKFDTLPAGQFRHKDHRFEWTRGEFQGWSGRIAERFGYNVRFLPVGEEDLQVGAPTQMGVFDRA